MGLTIEPRAYGPDSTPEEVEALRGRVSLHDGLTVLFHEVTILSEFQIDVCFDRIEELIREHDCPNLIIDLRNSQRPKARLARKLRQRMTQMENRLKRIAIFSGKNFMVNVAARFVLAGIPQQVGVYKTQAEAEEWLKDA